MSAIVDALTRTRVFIQVSYNFSVFPLEGGVSPCFGARQLDQGFEKHVTQEGSIEKLAHKILEYHGKTRRIDAKKRKRRIA
jgi:hypothetical protein